jgi:RNA polymerase sigma-70 factor (ECF subfamily)
MRTKHRRSIAEFFRDEHSHLVHFVRQLIDDTAEQDGEDLVQEVALNLFRRADVMAPIENLAAYIYRALRNKVIDEFRMRREEVVSLDMPVTDDSRLTLADILQDARESALQILEQDELKQRLRAAIDTLPLPQKAVIIETEFEGRSFRELSDLWDVPVGTLLARKSRGIQAIRVAFATDEYGG